jgi:hypothetical protein
VDKSVTYRLVYYVFNSIENLIAYKIMEVPVALIFIRVDFLSFSFSLLYSLDTIWFRAHQFDRKRLLGQPYFSKNCDKA